MIELEAGSRYGKTLFLGLKKEERRAALVDLEKILPNVMSEPLYTFFDSTIVPYEKKEAAFKSLFEGKVVPFLFRFLLFVIKKYRWTELPQILRSFSDRVQEEEGELSAKVTSAVPLDAEHRKVLLDRLKGTFHKELVLQENVDPKLLGGAILQVGNSLWDGSVIGKLNRMKALLLEVKK